MNNWRNKIMQFALGIIVVITLLVVVVWAGLQVKPTPFSDYPQASQAVETVPLPTGLPAPVDRFYRTIYGDKIPVIKSAVITGRAEVRPAGPLSFPARFRFTHAAGQGYRHYIEAGLYGLPLMKVNERYLDGKGYGETPFGVDQGDKTNQGANLGMWSELMWMPAVMLTDSRVHWEPLDDNTAVLVVPFGDTQEHYVVRFDPKTGLMDWMESMRYHGSTSEAKTLWMNKAYEWAPVNGTLTNVTGGAIWMDDGKPWAIFHLEDLRLNVDVQEYIRAKGL